MNYYQLYSQNCVSMFTILNKKTHTHTHIAFSSSLMKLGCLNYSLLSSNFANHSVIINVLCDNNCPKLLKISWFFFSR